MSVLLVDLTMCFARGRASVHGGGEYGKSAAQFLASTLTNSKVIVLIRADHRTAATGLLGESAEIWTVGDGPLERLPTELDQEENTLFLPLPAHFLEKGEPARARVVAVEHGLRDHEKAYSLANHLCHPQLGRGLIRTLLCAYAAASRRKRLTRADRRYSARLGALRETDRLVTPSHHSKYAMKLAFGANEAGPGAGLLDSITVLPPLSPFLDRRVASDRRDGTGILLLSVNRPIKNADRFLEGVARNAVCRAAVNRIGIDLVGTDARTRRRLQRRFGQTLSLRFHPYLEQGDLQSLIAGAYALVFPSLSEGFGIPPVDAFAHGTPVIASGTTAVSEVTAGAALLADPLQGDEMANRVLQLLEDADLYECQASAARTRYEELMRSTLQSWQAFSDQLDKQ